MKGSKPTTALPIITSSDSLLNSVELVKKLNCDFETKIFNAEIRENLIGRYLLTKLKPQNCENVWDLRYVIHQGKTDNFELNEESGEFFVIKPLDREKKGLHFIVVNITYSSNDSINDSLLKNGIRLRRQSASKLSVVNPIIECK